MSATKPTLNLWDRTRALVHAQVLDVAVSMFLADGFEATTVESIVAAAGISRRSFFRYFGTKEDIILGGLEEQGTLLVEALIARPADEDPWVALERAAGTLPSAAYSHDRAFAIATLVATTPSLRARHAQKHAEWQRALVPALQHRMGMATDPPSIEATAIVSTVLACLDAATDIWVENGGRGDLAELYRQAIAAVRGS
ncbi:TetR family transcriptional regulator [soil metagenome]